MKLFITEGIIRVPQSLVDVLYNATSNVLLSYLSDRLKEDYVIYEHYQLNGYFPVEESGGRFNYDKVINTGKLFPIPYSKKDVKYTEDDKRTTIKYSVSVFSVDALASYDVDNDAIIINATYLKKSIDSIVEKVLDENFQNMDSENKEFMLDMMEFSQELDQSIKNYLSKIKGVIEHELAHHIQYRYLKDKHSKQIKEPQDDSMSEYYTSDVEFSPQVISAINGFKEFYNEVVELLNVDANSQYLKAFLMNSVRYSTAITEKRPNVSDYIGNVPSSSYEALSRLISLHLKPSYNFFYTIKAKDEKLWKKAVRNFYTEVVKLIDLN